MNAPCEMVDVNLDPNKTSVMIGKQNVILEFLEFELKSFYNFPEKEIEVMENVKMIKTKDNVEKSDKVSRRMPHEEALSMVSEGMVSPSGDTYSEKSDSLFKKLDQPIPHENPQ